VVACNHGLCLAHGTDLSKRAEVTDVEHDMNGRRLAGKRPREEVDELCDQSSDDSNSGDDSDIDDRVMAPLGLAGQSEGDANLPRHSRLDVIPVYDVNRKLGGHFLWNLRYNVMRHSRGSESSLRVNAMLEHIVTVTGNLDSMSSI
jgi:hypothetical protein